jgi:hypothetical protein
VTDDPRLDRLRGAAPPKRHNARTIAALTGNPGCSRRAVLDAAGVDKPRLAGHIGFPARFGQSRFALVRGNAFEAQLKADGCAALLALLRDTLGLDASDVRYDDLGEDDDATLGARHRRTRDLLATAARTALVDHPLLTLDVAGQRVFLEPDLIAFQAAGRLHVVEIKSFAIVDGQADSAKVSAAATQAAVYVLALRRLLAELGFDEQLVSHEVVLVCPENFANRPTAVTLDVRRQLATLRRQLARLTGVADLVAALPDDLTFDMTRPAADVVAALSQVEARYAPECLSACELAYFCRHEARGATAALGRPVREALGGVTTVDEALALAAGTQAPADGQAEAATLLRAAARLRAEALSP